MSCVSSTIPIHAQSFIFFFLMTIPTPCVKTYITLYSFIIPCEVWLRESPYLTERPLTSCLVEDFMSRESDGELGHHWMEVFSRVFGGS